MPLIVMFKSGWICRAYCMPLQLHCVLFEMGRCHGHCSVQLSLHMHVALTQFAAATAAYGAQAARSVPPTATCTIAIGGARSPRSAKRSVRRIAKKIGVAAYPSMSPSLTFSDRSGIQPA